jgi:hypothetical protein
MLFENDQVFDAVTAAAAAVTRPALLLKKRAQPFEGGSGVFFELKFCLKGGGRARGSADRGGRPGGVSTGGGARIEGGARAASAGSALGVARRCDRAGAASHGAGPAAKKTRP